MASDALKPRRPRATAAELAERARLFDSRVDYCAAIMRRLEWRMGVTSEDLAREWNLPRSAMQAIVSAALKVIRAEYLDDHDRVGARVGVMLEHVLEVAAQSGDMHALLKALDLWARITGMGPPQRVHVTGDLSGLSNEQLKARKDEILKRFMGEGIQVKQLDDGGNDAAR